MEALDPQRVLERGFTITRTPEGELLRDPARAPVGTELTTMTAKGAVRSLVR